MKLYASWMVALLWWLHQATMTLAFLVDSTPTATACSTTTSPNKKAALVFLHGLGNSPQTTIPLIQDGLVELLDPQLSADLKFVFPSAPRLGSTINGGQCLPCWFDLYDWPVGVGVRDDRKGIRQAVQQIQREVALLEAEGIPKSRIVLGGFSQGATLALVTVYGNTGDEDHKESFAGCIALSGWLALREDLECTPEACQTPLFWGHGQFDGSVKPEQQFFGVQKLLQQGVQSTTTKSYEMGHGVSSQELSDMAEFLKRVIPSELIEETEPQYILVETNYCSWRICMRTVRMQEPRKKHQTT